MIYANFKIDDDGYIHRDNGAANDGEDPSQSEEELNWLNGDDEADNAKAAEYLINDILETNSHGMSKSVENFPVKSVEKFPVKL
jgi:hypothetical protein